MNVLFVYYVPSGGVETLNRLRCRILRNYGVNGHCLYYQPAAGLQNSVDFPLYVTKDDIAIKHIVDSGNYDAAVVTTDHKSFERLRMLGFKGKLVLEIQGYGPKEVARQQLTAALPVINAHASALLNPCTPHIAALFQELFSHIPQFHFNNCFDSAAFTYRETPKLPYPVIAWLGRIEDNKNWREFLYIGHQLSGYYPDLQMWMFEDPSISIPHEREQFKELIEELDLGSRLTVRPYVPNHEMQYYFSAIGDSGGFLCSTSKVEGAPYAVLEAMSCRCPVLTTPSDGVSSSVNHNVTGKYYALGDITHAVAEARELMENKVLRERIRGHAVQHVQAAFSPELYAQNFVRMLNAI